MSNIRKSSTRKTRVPLKFGDSIHNIVKKNSDKANINGSNGEMKKGNGNGGGGVADGEAIAVNTKGNDEFKGDLTGDNFPALNSQVSSSTLVGDVDKNVTDVSMHVPLIPVNNVETASISVDKENIVVDKSNVGTNVMMKNVNERKSVSDELKKTNDNNDANDNKKGNMARNAMLNGAWGKSSKFADVVAASKLDNKLLVIPTEISDNGEEVVVFNEEIIEEGSNKWNLTVCGQFVGCSMNLNEARYHIRRMWNKFGLKDITVNESGIFFFKFHDNEGINEVINNGPWMVNNIPMFVQRWSIDVCLDKAEPKCLPVWVKLLKIPMEAWSLKGVSALASSLGKPIIMDETTTRMCLTGEGKIGFARVLVEINAEKVIKDKIEIVYKGKNISEGMRKIVEVEYAWKPFVCEHCKVFGHDLQKCNVKLRTETELLN